jgi:hypothetical protein
MVERVVSPLKRFQRLVGCGSGCLLQRQRFKNFLPLGLSIAGKLLRRGSDGV